MSTKTTNPLHFEDLDPHRFEDLVRQLIYDFKNWRYVEALGRSGSDEGIDIKAVERNVGFVPSLDDDDEVLDQSIEETVSSEERCWFVQCKRHKRIGPTQVRQILQEGPKKHEPKPYGYILAAACTFSKVSRQEFHSALANMGIEERYIWGREELEDMLFLPKNDYLLFAYFGISQARTAVHQLYQAFGEIAQRRMEARAWKQLHEDCQAINLKLILIRGAVSGVNPEMTLHDLESQWRTECSKMIWRFTQLYTLINEVVTREFKDADQKNNWLNRLQAKAEQMDHLIDQCLTPGDLLVRMGDITSTLQELAITSGNLLTFLDDQLKGTLGKLERDVEIARESFTQFKRFIG